MNIILAAEVRIYCYPMGLVMYWSCFGWYILSHGRDMRNGVIQQNIISMATLHRQRQQNIIHFHYGDVIMGAIVSQITSLAIVYSTVYSDAEQRKHQSSASLAFVWEIHRGPVNSPHKWSVTRKMTIIW